MTSAVLVLLDGRKPAKTTAIISHQWALGVPNPLVRSTVSSYQWLVLRKSKCLRLCKAAPALVALNAVTQCRPVASLRSLLVTLHPRCPLRALLRIPVQTHLYRRPICRVTAPLKAHRRCHLHPRQSRRHLAQVIRLL